MLSLKKRSYLHTYLLNFLITNASAYVYRVMSYASYSFLQTYEHC